MHMFDYYKHFEKTLLSLKEEGRYRHFRNISRHCGEFPFASLHEGGEERRIEVWCSNDYLGMGQNDRVLGAMMQTLMEDGAGAGGTRNISGTHTRIVELENELADLHHKEAALVFSSGYVANETTLSTLGTMLPECTIFSDSHNHASMIEGMRHSKAHRKIFRHNDPKHLEELFGTIPASSSKVVAFESLYSMDGDFGCMRELIDVAQAHGALIYVDETHAVGVYGPRGGGLLEEHNLLDQVDVVQGGLGKGFGVVGGFITGRRELVDVVRSLGSGFIFTTTLPPVIAAGACTSVKYLKRHSEPRETLFSTVKKVRDALRARGLPICETSSQIIPLMVGEARLCQELSDKLLKEYSIYLQPINYPTVPVGTERFRITPSVYATPEMIERFVTSLSELWSRMGGKLAA